MKCILAVVLFSGLACAVPYRREVPFNEDDLAQVMMQKRDDGMSMGMVKTFIKKTLENPAVKKMANPQALEKMLNQDVSGSGGAAYEIFDMIWTSDIVKSFTTPEVFQMIVNSKFAKTVLSKDFILAQLNQPAVKSLLSPNTIRRVLDSDNIAGVLEPATLAAVIDNPTVLNALDSIRNFDPAGVSVGVNVHDTKVYKALARYEFVKVILHSQFARKFFGWGWIHALFNNDLIATKVITAPNVKDAFASPLMVQLMDPAEYGKLFDSKVMNSLLSPAVLHEIFYSESFTKLATMDTLEKVLKSSSLTASLTDASVADYVGAPAFKSLTSEEAMNKYIATSAGKAWWKNPAVKAALANAAKIFGGA